MKILSSVDTHVGSQLVRTFTVLADKETQHAAGAHCLRIHTQHGATDMLVMLQAERLFGGLGKVHHVAPAHHREWKVWVEVKNAQ